MLYVMYALEILMYFAGLFAGERLTVEGYTLIQKIAGIWVIGHVYLFVSVLIFDFVHFINGRFLLFKVFKERIIRKTKICCFLIFLLFIGFQLYRGYENYLHPKMKTIPFTFNKPGDQSVSPNASYRLLVASDLHLGYIVGANRLRQYVEFINSRNPDIVVIDGDLIDFTLRPLIAGKMDEELRKIKAPKGIFFVPGNHEYKFNPELKLDWIAKAGFTILKDSVVVIDDNLTLIGRDDRVNKKRLYIETLMSKADLQKPCIFFAHQPGDIIDGYRYDIPLTVCGHTHGGQVFPVNILGTLVYTNVYGLQKHDDSYSYTTSGLGLSGFPLRIASDSEIVVFNIEIY
jgi:predicted MPP superfamily phosphohydrolase